MPQIAPSPLILDAAGMPTITAAGVSLHVHAYITGRTRSFAGPTQKALSPGCPEGAADLWYLSLVADVSEATALEGIWSYLADRASTTAFLQDPNKPNGHGVTVMLGRHRQDLASLGWRPRFRWLTAALPGTESLHGVLEPLELMACSGQQARGQGAHRTGGADPAALEKEVKEEQAKQQAPLFILTARPQDQPELKERSQPLAHFYLRFLASRCHWLAYHEPHQRYLWERAWAEGEVEELYTSCYADAGKSSWLAGAYLCRPQLLKLNEALSLAIRRGAFGRPATNGRSAP